MPLYLFRSLSTEAQLYYVLTRGTFLTWRWKEEAQLMLHYLPDGGRGFFVELGVNEEQTQFSVLRSFRSTALLEYYTYLCTVTGIDNTAPDIVIVPVRP